MKKQRICLLSSTFFGRLGPGTWTRSRCFKRYQVARARSGAVEITTVSGATYTVPNGGYTISDGGILSVDAVFATAIVSGGGGLLLLWMFGGQGSAAVGFTHIDPDHDPFVSYSWDGGELGDSFTDGNQVAASSGNVVVTTFGGDDAISFGNAAAAYYGSITVNAGSGENQISLVKMRLPKGVALRSVTVTTMFHLGITQRLVITEVLTSIPAMETT